MRVLVGSTLILGSVLYANPLIYRCSLNVFEVCKAVADYKVSSMIGEDVHITHKRNAERMRAVLAHHGGVYIKLGQHISQLNYLLPAEYVDAMQCMLDNAPRSPWAHVQRQLERHGVWDAIMDIEQEPIASASLAQVHLARDAKSGQKLAIKVQHPGLMETCAVDIDCVYRITKTLHQIYPQFDYNWLAEEMKMYIPLELDFEHEGRNADMCRERVTNDTVCVPAIHWDKTSKQVLTMDFEEGCKVTDLDAMQEQGLSTEEVSMLLSKTFCKQIFIDGFVHCDPHPGNIFVRKNAAGQAQLVLLDHGLYKELSPEFRLSYAQLWKSILTQDDALMRSSCASLHVQEDMYRLLASMVTNKTYTELMKGDMDTLRVRRGKQQNAELRGHAVDYFSSISHILSKVPRDLLFMFKTNDILRSIDTILNTKANTFINTARYSVRCINTFRPKTCISAFKGWMDIMLMELRILSYRLSRMVVGAVAAASSSTGEVAPERAWRLR